MFKLILLPLLVMLTAYPMVTIDAIASGPVVVEMASRNHVDALWNPADPLPVITQHEFADQTFPGEGLEIRGYIGDAWYSVFVVGEERGHVWFVTEGRVDHSPFFRPCEAVRFIEQMVKVEPRS